MEANLGHRVYDTARDLEPYHQATPQRAMEYHPEELRYGHNSTPGRIGHHPENRQPVHGGPY